MTSGFLYESFGGIYWRFIFNQSVSKLQPLVLKICGIVTSVDLGGLVVGGSQQIFKAPGPKATKNLVEVSWLLAGKLSNFNQHWIFRADFYTLCCNLLINFPFSSSELGGSTVASWGVSQKNTPEKVFLNVQVSVEKKNPNKSQVHVRMLGLGFSLIYSDESLF